MAIYILNFALILLYGLIFKNKKTFVTVSAIQLFLILALRDPLLGVDNAVYMFGYEYISNLSFVDMLSCLDFLECAELVYPCSFESGYVVLNWLVSFIGLNFHGFLILHAAFCIGAASKFIYRHSKNCCLSFLLFISLEFFTYQFGILRQTLVMAIFVLAFPLIKERKLFKFLLACLLAFTVHRVAIIILPLYWMCNIKLNRKRYVFVLSLLAAFLLLSPSLISMVTKVMDMFGKNVYLQSVNMNALFLNMALFAILFLLFYGFENNTNDTFNNNILIWCFIFAIAIEIIGLYSDLLARAIYIPYVAIIALLPNVLENYKNRSIATLVKVALTAFAFVFMIIDLSGDFINPYVFFFE